MGLLFFVLLLRSILQGEPKTLIFFLLLPLVFIVVGAVGLYSAIKGPKPKPAPGSGLTEALSEKAVDPRKGAWFMVLFFALFLVIGLGVSYALLFRPALRLVRPGTGRRPNARFFRATWAATAAARAGAPTASTSPTSTRRAARPIARTATTSWAAPPVGTTARPTW